MPNSSNSSSLHAGHRNRLKKKFLKNGLDSFSDHEVLELLLFYSLSRQDTNPLGHALIEKYEHFFKVFDAKYDDLLTVPGISEHTATLIKLIPQICQRYMEDKQFARKLALRTENEIFRFLSSLFVGCTQEVLYIVCMDKNCRILHHQKISQGTIDETALNLRLIIDIVLKTNASRVILAHNHPSGTLSPSPSDIEASKKVKLLLESMDVHFDDHFIVSDKAMLSMNSKGHFE